MATSSLNPLSTMPAQTNNRPPVRHIMTRQTALAVAERLFQANPAIEGVSIEHIAHSVTKVANGKVLEMNDGDIVRLDFPSKYGPGFELSIATNQLDESFLQQVIAETITKVPKRPPAPSRSPRPPRTDVVDKEGDLLGPMAPRPAIPVDLYHQTTVDAMETARGTVIPAIVNDLKAAQMSGAATVRLVNRSVLYCYRQGLQSFAEETDSEVTVTARTGPNAGTGWSGQAHRDWSKLTPAAVTARAIEVARRNRTPVAVEPGRRTAILSPAAVAQFMRKMAGNFVGTGSGPLQFPNAEFGSGRQSKLGMRIFDPRLVMMSDPADPDGGYAPFFERGGINTAYDAGFPTPGKTWVEGGVLKNLAWWVEKAALRGLTPSEPPVAFRLTTVPGTRTATIDEMIANCREGIYVNRFSQVERINDDAGTVRGTTRDGCFLVKDGKITKSIVNLRFLDSPFAALNRVEMIGVPERVSFGDTVRFEMGLFTPNNGLPPLPVIVPALMIRDFNFSALANAV